MPPELEGLPDELRDAVTHRGGPLLVLGPAGTGKTATLVERFVWLATEEGVRPERIAVVVPSAARGLALRTTLEERLAEPYEQLVVGTPLELAGLLLERAGEPDALDSVLSAGELLALLLEHVDQLSLSHHDFGGRVSSLLGSFVRRIDRLKASLVSAEEFAASVEREGDPVAEREFAEVYRLHERLLADLGARDAGDLLRDALRMLEARDGSDAFEAMLVDDAHELSSAGERLVLGVGRAALTVAADPARSGSRFVEVLPGARVVRPRRSLRSAPPVVAAAAALVAAELEPAAELDPGPGQGSVEFWRCASGRAQAQAVAADIERLLGRAGVLAGDVAVLVPSVAHEGQAVAVALEERAVAHRLVGEAAFFQRAEIRDVLAWLRLLADPSDAGAVVRALARPPVDLRSVDIARCTQIARRRKLDMVGALAAALESPQVPPEARERILTFLKIYRSAVAAIDTTRPDLFVHRLIERLGLRRQQLFAAQADVVERLRALARFADLAAAYVRRAPQATPREFARSISAVAEFGLPEQEEPALGGAAGAVQVVGLGAIGGLEARHVYLLGLDAGSSIAAESLYLGITRARERVVIAYAAEGGVAPLAATEQARRAVGGEWDEKDEELFGPAETLHSTYRLLRDELLESTMRVGGRLGELRFDTDLDVSHAVVRYLELVKLAALIARPEGEGLSDALRDINNRILQAVTAEQREIFSSSALDDYLMDAERDARRRAQAVAARDEPSLEPFLPLRGEGVVLSASDIDTYRTCPLKYKFARIFRIPQEPTVNQRFGILVHQVLERFHARAGGDGGGAPGSLAELLGLLDAGWRRNGFGDSEEERQLRGKAASALTRYWERFQSEESQPVWFERQFTFKLGPHLLRGRVDRVDRLPGGEYELIDYKTGRPKSPAQLAEDVQLSLYAVGAREAWSLESSQQAYYYLLDDEKVAVPADAGGFDRDEWIREVAVEVAEGILSQGFEPTPSFAACSVCDYRLVCPAAER